jgi:hypothetical protein
MIYGSVSTNNYRHGEIVPLKASCVSTPTAVPEGAELGSAVAPVTTLGIHSLGSEGPAGKIFKKRTTDRSPSHISVVQSPVRCS